MQRSDGNRVLLERPGAIAGIPHPIPYQGSKRQLAKLIVNTFPPSTRRLIEPFAGSAAVSVAAAQLGRATGFVLNDVHAPLMALWREIILRPNEISAKYAAIWRGQLGDERFYYDRVRSRFNRFQRPEDFLYLLARCVKAAIRYNSNGEFNNSPDNRRLGAHPLTMERHIRGASRLLAARTKLLTGDFRRALSLAKPFDVVYLDPPYQGVCRTHNHRYIRAVSFDDFVEALRELHRRDVPFVVSYDGRTGDKRFGRSLPEDLKLMHLEVPAGRSTQATLLGRSHHTYESLYLSRELVKRGGASFLSPERAAPGQLSLFSEAV